MLVRMHCSSVTSLFIVFSILLLVNTPRSVTADTLPQPIPSEESPSLLPTQLFVHAHSHPNEHDNDSQRHNDLFSQVRSRLSVVQQLDQHIRHLVHLAQDDMKVHHGRRHVTVSWDDIRCELRHIWPLLPNDETTQQRRRQIDATIRSLPAADKIHAQHQREVLSLWATEAGRAWIETLDALLREMPGTEERQARFEATAAEINRAFDALAWLSGPLCRRYEMVRSKAMERMWSLFQQALPENPAELNYHRVRQIKGEIIDAWQTAAETILARPWTSTAWSDTLSRVLSTVQDVQAHVASRMQQLANKPPACPCAESRTG